MSYSLTIDQGNSTSKVCVFENDKIVNAYRFDTLTIEDLCNVIEEYDVHNVVYCSVARLDVRLIESLRYTLKGDLIVLTHETPLPIEIEYDTPNTLGLDRIAAVVGANYLFPGENALVVDAGTATTLDVLAEGEFVGGNISPGLSLRFKSLNNFTARLPLIDHRNLIAEDFGKDTQSAILSGVVNGLVAEIIVSFETAKQSHRCKKLVLTGGDAEYISSYLSHLSDCIAIEGNLVAIGLNRILNYNEDI